MLLGYLTTVVQSWRSRSPEDVLVDVFQQLPGGCNHVLVVPLPLLHFLIPLQDRLRSPLQLRFHLTHLHLERLVVAAISKC